MTACIFCSNKTFEAYAFPKTSFNSKLFSYKRCSCCKLVQLNPHPNNEDYNLMYPSSYQVGINSKVFWKEGKAAPGLRFSYKLQLDLMARFINLSNRVLDYGCGDANFLINAKDYGFTNLEGAEFGQEIVSILQEQESAIRFINIAEILDSNNGQKFDCIRLSNVLEHITNPREVLKILFDKLNDGGILLLEGPLEDNFYPMNLINRYYFWLKTFINKNSITYNPPYHIFFSNVSNQVRLFEEIGFKTLFQEVKELSWPYPAQWSDAIGIKNKILYFLSLLSRSITSISSKNWGNTILYIGQK